MGSAVLDPVKADWRSAQARMIERLLPHVRNYVHVSRSLAGARALGASFSSLLDQTRIGVIQLDWHGRLLAANDSARDLLRQGNGLTDQGGFLGGHWPEDDARLARLVAAALPAGDAQAEGGSMPVRRRFAGRGLVLNVRPMTFRQMDLGVPEVGALVLVEDLDRPVGLDAERVGSVLGLTATEGQVAVLLAEGRSVPEIARLLGRAPTSVRTHVKSMHRKLGVSRRQDLVRLVLSVPEGAGLRHRR